MVKLESLKKSNQFKKALKEKKIHSECFSIFAAKNFYKPKFKTNLIIGSDGIDGVSRKFVVGSNSYIKRKKIYRTVSHKVSAYNLSKTILQVLLHEYGYYVIYPTIINNEKATNLRS